MRSKFYILITIFTFFISFSQRKPGDSLVKCNGILKDRLLNTLQNAYQERLNKPQEPRQIFGCGTAAMQYLEELNCSTAKYILEKYPFILTELEKLKQDYPNYLNLNAFWIQKIERSEKDKIFTLNEDEEAKLENWKTKRNHARFSVIIVSNKVNDNNEYIQLKIIFPKEVIIKLYQLSYNNTWNFKSL